MKKILTLCFILFPFTFILAQETAETDTVEVNPAFNYQITPYMQWNKVFGRTMAYSGIEMEMVVREHVLIGVFGEVMLGTIIKRTLFPNLYEFRNYKYGLVAGYNYSMNDKLQVTGGVKASRQHVKWMQQEGESFSISDNCTEIRPFLGVNYVLTENILAGGAIGYNIANGVELPGIEQKNMHGLALNLNIGIRF